MFMEAEGIYKKYGSYVAADYINFTIQQGSLVGILGPSGSGKTTLLRMIAGLESMDQGRVSIQGICVNDMAPGKREIGFVFQNYALFRYMTVFDNVAFGLKIKKEKNEEIRNRVMELIELVGLKGLEKRYPYQLSGGQRQRVAFARALAPGPRLLLLDEPFAAVDTKIRKELRRWLKKTIQQVGITSLFVTHDQDEAVEVADEIIIMNQGKIEQKGTPFEIYNRPSTPFVAQFIGENTLLEDYNRLKGFEKGRKGKAAVSRPEFIELFSLEGNRELAPAWELGTVRSTLFRGNCQEIQVEVKGMILTASWALEKRMIQQGEQVGVMINQLFELGEHNTELIRNENLQEQNLIYL